MAARTNNATEQAPEGVNRAAAIVEYNGSQFFGWQRQIDLKTPGVQNAVEHAISRVANEETSVICAGRTDTGVHATHQVIHFDSVAERNSRQWLLGVNANLPDHVRLRSVTMMPADFHARFSAQSRRYVYCIDNRAVKPGVFSGLHSWCRLPLDHELMHTESQALLGEHDFSGFRAAGCQAKTANRRVISIAVRRAGHMVLIDICANAFLQHMVRNIAGVLMAVGCGERSVGWTREVLDSADRRQGGVTAVPHGLYLVGVQYPERFPLPTSNALPYF
ncbi:MAG: tRNA pseudouridine(38-40) synthase TruA [Pseudomonadales bacterium]